MSIEREFEIDGLPEIDVRIQSGRVELVKREPGRVEVTVDTDDRDFVVEQRGDLIVVASDKNTSWLARGSAFVVITAPESSAAVIATASARVESQIPLGHVEVKTASGDVEIESAQAADIKTASGDARIGSTKKTLRFKSASGDLLVTESCEGTATFASASGDIHINQADATLDVNTVSGDVIIPRFGGQKAGLKSMSGNIRLGIPAGTKLDLDASLLSGKLHLPEPQEETTPTRRHMSIRAKLVSGDLLIDRVD